MEPRALPLIACGVIFALAVPAVPLISRLAPPNRTYGPRTPKTLSRPELWYPANLFAGCALMLAAALAALIISRAPGLSDIAYAAIFVALVLGAAAAALVCLAKIA